MHYAGVSYDLPEIAAWCEQEGIMLVEDAAQSMGAWHGVDLERKHLGRFGALATFSFHETKNITSGEGGCLVVNQESLWGRACVIWEKGTNRQAFFRGEVDKYGWVDAGSSFLPNEITMAQLLGQLEHLESITSRRRHIWTRYLSDSPTRCPWNICHLIGGQKPTGISFISAPVHSSIATKCCLR